MADMSEVGGEVQDVFGPHADEITRHIQTAHNGTEALLARFSAAAAGANNERIDVIKSRIQDILEGLGAAATNLVDAERESRLLLAEWGVVASADPTTVQASGTERTTKPTAFPETSHLDKAASSEIRAAVAGLPLYNCGPGVDYTNAPVAYTASTVLMHGPTLQRNPRTGRPTPTTDTEILIVQRGSGDGVHGSWSGVSGYIDKVKDPAGKIRDDDFDPVAHTAHAEMSEECGLSPDDAGKVTLGMGTRFTEPRRNGGTLHVLPVSGVYAGDEKPAMAVDGREVVDYRWVRLGEVSQLEGLSPGFITQTLPGVLEGLGLEQAEIQRILNPEP